MMLKAILTCLRVARQQGWPEGIWATQLAGLLSGDALDASSSLLPDTAQEYARVKEAILTQYKVIMQRLIASASVALSINQRSPKRCC